jgi:membrane-bound lytic murein transglycosylase D
VADANDLAAGAELEEGQKLIIPAAARAETSTGKLIRYRVRRTDTIATIADEFDVTTAELRKWNHIRSDHVVRGTSLRIYPGGMTPGPAQQEEASNHSKSTNAALPVTAHAHADPGAGITSNAALGSAGRTPIMEARANTSVVHRVKQGETLWSIARAYQTTVEAIQAGNRYLFSRPLQVGDTLTILQAH